MSYPPLNSTLDSVSEISAEQRALEQKCGMTVSTLLGICTVVQALPICLARGSIRRRLTPNQAQADGRFAVHHIIPIEFATHDILWRMKGLWDQNDPAANGLVLATSSAQGFASKLPFHAGPHPQYSRCIAASLDSMANFRDRTGSRSDELLPVFTRFVSHVRAAVLELPPGTSINWCRIEWFIDERER
jgi:hypothetical protein